MTITIEKKVDGNHLITVDVPEVLIETIPVVIFFGMKPKAVKNILSFCGPYAKVGKTGEIIIDANLFIISMI